MATRLDNPELESLFLGSLLLMHENERTDALLLLSPDTFSLSRNAAIFEGIQATHNEGACTVDAVATWTLQHRKLEVGVEALDEMVATTPFNEPVQAYAAKLRELAGRRQVVAAARRMMELAQDLEKPIADVMTEVESLVLAATQPAGEELEPVPFDQLAMERMIDLEDQLQRQAVPALATNYASVDSILKGCKPRKTCGVMGRPGMGKSSFCLDLAMQFVLQGAVVLYFHLEMDNQESTSRLAASKALVDYSRIESAWMGADEQAKVFSALGDMASEPWMKNLFFLDVPGLTWEQIRSQCLRTRSKMGRLDAVFVDHLHIVNYNRNRERQELDRITADSKTLAKQLGLNFWWMIQMSRGAESRTNKRPVMSDGREGGAIEQNLDLIVGLYREEYYDPDTPDRGILEVGVQKYRGGRTGTAKLLYQPQYNRFVDTGAKSPVPTFCLPPVQPIRLGGASW